MSQDSTPYDAAIEDIRSQMAQLQTMLDGLESLRSRTGGGVFTLPGGNTRASGDSEIHHDTFFGMTIGDAAKKFLNMVKVTKSTGEIAQALERGGLKHSSKDFNTTVRSVLGGREDFLRVNGDWGLTEWYPSMRNRERKTKGSTKSVVDAPVPYISLQDLPEPVNVRVAPTDKTPRGENIQKAFALLADNPDKTFSSTEIHERIGVGTQASVASMLSDQAKVGRIARGNPNGYRANEVTIKIAQIARQP